MFDALVFLWSWIFFVLKIGLEILGGFIILHVIVSFLVLVQTRFQKDENGEYLIDSKSWHFNLVYGRERNDLPGVFEEKFAEMQKNGLWICKYCAMVTLRVAWFPFRVLAYVLKLIILVGCDLIAFPVTGRYVSGRYFMWGEWMDLDDMFERIPLLTLGKDEDFTIWPLPTLALVAAVPWFVYKLILWQTFAVYTLAVIVTIVAIVSTILFAIFLHQQFFTKKIVKEEGRTETVSVLGQAVGSLYKTVCPKAKVV